MINGTEKYDYFLAFNDSGTVINEIEKINTTDLNPVNTWDSLKNKLKENNILTLPAQNTLSDKLRKEVETQRGKGYLKVAVLDGDSYEVLVRDNSRMNQFQFHSPWSYKNHFPDVVELSSYIKIIEILETELKLKLTLQ